MKESEFADTAIFQTTIELIYGKQQRFNIMSGFISIFARVLNANSHDLE